ncbi:Chemotaxis sensory transducer [Candidatus Terasakiella magnetica]|uniref:Chemotaxis sensory transducer n=1 Tax=Candidatus Terasakiella magnetica TaxID=1867952 RepID=A0A1C3REH5_9PROT|nr:PAS domain-containing protein [Candidatus Terasakiella magnetica]SCA55669.1 Chemotaxis sensory transducer [Candidatus Terasakiella magnetica]
MTNANNILTGEERTFGDDEIIVSKTDLKGRITYANKIFLDVAGYILPEVMGQPHSMIRHPDMPRCVFKLLWDTMAQKKELFAYVMNRCKNGDHYWVLAHVTPSFDVSGNIVGYHSNRRVPKRDTLDNIIIPLYAQLLQIEQSHQNRKEGMEASTQHLMGILNEKGVAYDEFILSI